MIERTNIQALVFSTNPSFKALILKRTPERSGYWQPVCGGIENGEADKYGAHQIEICLKEQKEKVWLWNLKK